jgi:uncharacterized protein DUF397
VHDFSAANWRKSSRSSDVANCVEVAFDGPAVGVRDSKNTGPLLAFGRRQWAAFLAGEVLQQQ